MDFSTDLGSMDFSQMMSAVPKGAMIGGIVCGLIVMVIMLIAQWKLFTKAGKPGWHSIIPILSMYQRAKPAGNASFPFTTFTPLLKS